MIGRFIADALHTAARFEELGGELIELAARHLSDSEAAKVRTAVFDCRALLASAQAECPLGALEHIEERLAAAEGGAHARN